MTNGNYGVCWTLDGQPQGWYMAANMAEALKIDERIRARYGAERTTVNVKPVSYMCPECRRYDCDGGEQDCAAERRRISPVSESALSAENALLRRTLKDATEEISRQAAEITRLRAVVGSSD